jgi:hypothetical protein
MAAFKSGVRIPLPPPIQSCSCSLSVWDDHPLTMLRNTAVWIEPRDFVHLSEKERVRARVRGRLRFRSDCDDAKDLSRFLFTIR